ncbi:hypothetical protein K7X08_004247 [Anisodus acutangulus]|uniref:Uncharacterized protein n=1 Tax=Anisodus acutangulus TaxID=402998 RepID=A0A9Q1RJY4_9SOLA|nr:hypothetical protein K7X08_004247 [Anisodus acutangulus]
MRHLEVELEKERAPQLEAEQNVEAALMNVEDMSSLLKESLERQQRLRVTSKFTGITSKLLEQWAIERADRVESKPREMRHLEAELEKERAPQLEAEQNAEATLMNVEDMSSLLKESLEGKRLRVAEELQARKLAFPTGMCHIL